MHVDGFRFDLAATLARELHEVDRLSAFFDLIQQDPDRQSGQADRRTVGRRRGRLSGRQLSRRCGPSGTASTATRCATTGAAPIRRSAEFANRLSGSPDLYASNGRRPSASVNFVTAHDGFTLRDLVSYNDKHNEANGEDNRDGESHNRSWNHGVEGPTDDPAIIALRARQQRNFLATLLLSQGVPMLLAGDEIGRTQRRQQQRLLPGQRDVLDRLGERRPRPAAISPCQLLAFRRAHPVFPPPPLVRGPSAARRRTSATSRGSRRPGRRCRTQDWSVGFAKSLMVFLNGKRDPEPRAARRGDRRRHLPALLQRALRAAAVHAARRDVSGRAGAASSTRPIPICGADDRCHARRADARVEDRSMVVLQLESAEADDAGIALAPTAERAVITRRSSRMMAHNPAAFGLYPSMQALHFGAEALRARGSGKPTSR